MAKTVIRPLNGKVVIKPIEEENKAILILEGSEESPETGIVEAVGTGRVLESGEFSPVLVKKGDKILFNRHAPDKVSIGGETYLLLADSAIMAIIE